MDLVPALFAVVLRGTRSVPPIVAIAMAGACASAQPPETVIVPVVDTLILVDTVEVMVDPGPDPDLQRRVAGLELQVLEKEGQVDELQGKLEAAMQEVVRAMAKLQSQANRAEAASVMAEAGIALQAVTSAEREPPPDVAEAQDLLNIATEEFNKGNYGGAVYMAGQARSVARAAEQRLAGPMAQQIRSGEVLFALPLPLEARARSNVRQGPGVGFSILFTVDPGTMLTGYSHLSEWIRIGDVDGRSGWILHSLVVNRRETGH
jgi:Bacterial SH3 domain